MQQRRQPVAPEQPRPDQKQPALEQRDADLPRRRSVALPVERRHHQEKHDHENVLKQRDPQARPRPRIVLLAEILERHHRHRRRAQRHRRSQHDAVRRRKSERRG